MKKLTMLFIAMACSGLLLLPSVQCVSQAACLSPAKIIGSSYNPTSIQDAYDYASQTLALADFTLQISGEMFSEDLFMDGGNVVFDGGYDCSFSARTQTPTDIFGKLTISNGSVTIINTVSIVSTDQCIDRDGDGFTECGFCNDLDPFVNPGALEICDGIDNNCNGQIDEGLPLIDADGDGYFAIGLCGDPAYTDDCNDNDPTIHPNAADTPYDGIDQNCNGSDLTFAEDNNCINCHGAATSWADIHALVSPPDSTCASCHNSQVNNILLGHYGQVVRTAGNNIVADAVISCASCHDQVSPMHSFGANIVWPKVDAVLPNVTCDTCHESRAAAHLTATAHDNRIIDTNCGVCHTSDISVPGAPGTGTLNSAADVDTLHRSDCTLCHNYSGTILNAALIRQVIEQGLNGTQVTCLDCHDVYNPPPPQQHSIEVGPNDLSQDPPGQLCSACHLAANWNEIETLHDVPTNGAGSCATCHSSVRQDVIDTIAIAANPTHCTACHSDKYLTVHGMPVHTSPINVCLPCHNPGPVPEGEFMAIHNSNCTLCHTTIPNLQPGLPFAAVDCNTCHVSNWEALHTTNTPDHSSLVRFSSTTCYPCHIVPPPLVNGGPPNSHNGCSSCHDTDGALISGAIGKDFITGGDCLTCHVAYFGNPGTPDHSSLVQVATSTCAACHDNTLFGPEAINHNGCSSCHMPTGALISLAIGKDFATGGDCATCHTAPFETLHPNHVHTVAEGPGDLTYDAPGTLCSTCHVVSTWAEIESVEHNVATNGAGSCATCHNSPRQEVIDAITLGANPTNCLDCHSDYNLSPPPSVDHVALGYVTGGTSPCLTCHDPGATYNATVAITHLDNCSICHTTAPALKPGIPVGGGDCVTCHVTAPVPDATWEGIHISNPPNHTALVQVAATACANCHDNTLVGAKSHFACNSCHNADGFLVSIAIGKTFAMGGNCQTCHTSSWENLHPGGHDHIVTIMPLPSSCTNCHSISRVDAPTHAPCAACHDLDGSLHPWVPANLIDCSACHTTGWEPIHYPVTPDHSILVEFPATGCSASSCHTVPPSLISAETHTGCVSCHDTEGLLISRAVGKDFTSGGDCLTCHDDYWQPPVPTPDHSSLVRVGSSNCGSCHDDAYLTNDTDPRYHNACSSCHDVDGSLISRAIGQDFTSGGDCLTCHFDTWEALHPNAPDHTNIVNATYSNGCVSCHDDTLVSPSPLTHNACTSCHDPNTGVMIGSAAGKPTLGTCNTCHPTFDVVHSSHVHTVEEGPSDLAYVAPGQLCSACHTASDWVGILSEHDIILNGAGPCATCHFESRQEVQDAIALAANPTNCLDCHSEYAQITPPVVDHVALGYVIPGSGLCLSCHALGSGADATVLITHQNNCDLCHTIAPALKPGIPAGGGVCSDCHSSTWETLHATNTPSHSSLVQVATTSCSGCHNDPPPLTDNADPLVHNACASCHSTDGGLIGRAVGKSFSMGGTCETCHTESFEVIHPGP